MTWLVMTTVAAFILGTYVARARSMKRLLDVEPVFPLECPKSINVKDVSIVLDALISKGAYTRLGGRILVRPGRDESSLAFLLETGVVSITPNGGYVTTQSRTRAFREWAYLEQELVGLDREWDTMVSESRSL